ncbi:MAG: RIP metalloprotease RseP [Gammaproteobacteria bacterium]|nr:MAG: RIP metalloprotease RseP [Gammaproteobacteria bacterium]
MEFLWNLVAFVIALGVLVSFHEYGHFWVARKLGVKVLTFSVGFGKPLFEKTGKDGVRYVLAAVPLGGYVKMLDEREAPVKPEEVSMAFNRQSVWTRIAIVLAGPVANFLLAIALYWIVFISGQNVIIPVVGEIDETSIAGKAGLSYRDQIIAVDGESVTTLQDMTLKLVARIGEKGHIRFKVSRFKESQFDVKEFDARQTGHSSSTSRMTRELILNIDGWQVDSARPEVMHSLGIYHFLEFSEIGMISSNDAADRAGFRVGDQLISIDGKKADLWQDMAKILALSAGKEVKIEIRRNGELILIPVVIGSQVEDGKKLGKLGISRDFKPFFIKQEYGIVESLSKAVNKTYAMIELTTRVFGKLFSGEISVKSLSGPVSIAKGAGDSANIGLISFLLFVAGISVNLGFINLLPIPMLDGGHLLYFVIELVKGKPLAERTQEFGLQVGMMMVFALMAFAIFNDFSRI